MRIYDERRPNGAAIRASEDAVRNNDGEELEEVDNPGYWKVIA